MEPFVVRFSGRELSTIMTWRASFVGWANPVINKALAKQCVLANALAVHHLQPSRDVGASDQSSKISARITQAPHAISAPPPPKPLPQGVPWASAGEDNYL